MSEKIKFEAVALVYAHWDGGNHAKLEVNLRNLKADDVLDIHHRQRYHVTLESIEPEHNKGR